MMGRGGGGWGDYTTKIGGVKMVLTGVWQGGGLTDKYDLSYSLFRIVLNYTELLCWI